jgi:shikimate dehydrogenase
MTDRSGCPIDAGTELYGIIGNPVGHSLSPAMHNAAFRHLGINAVYLAFEVSDPESAISGVRALNISGLSVTVPHKEAVMPLLDRVDENAGRIGAVNTIVNRNGMLEGMNTDMSGAVRAISEKTGIKGAAALVLGAGGSARAVVAGLAERGADVHIANRTETRAKALAERFGASWSGLEGLESLMMKRPASIIVNTTTLGMHPRTDIMPVSPALLDMAGKAGSVVMDIAYSPLETMLLREAASRGCPTVNGLEMLFYQAVEQFRIWTGRNAPEKTMRRALEKARKD